MKFLKSSWKVFLAVVVGFLLGAMIHARATKAAPPVGSTMLKVTPISMSGMNSGSGFVGGEIVGFSCVPDNSNPGDGVCYVATR
jgi:hypothetical protein